MLRMVTWLETLPMHTFDIRNVHRQSIPPSSDSPLNNGVTPNDEQEDVTQDKSNENTPSW